MTVFKSSNISVEIRNGKVDIGDVGVKFYTQDINTTLLNIRVLKDEQFLNFNDEQYKPFINLFMGDGSVFLDQPVEISDAENGLLTYKLADKVKHAGWVKFKLILKKEDESLHAANFKLEILDSGLESEIGRVIDVDILMNAFERFALKYPEKIRGKAFTYEDFTEEQLALLKGPKGDDGPKGEPGADGKDGANGKSAYELAVENGFKGSEAEWLASLKKIDNNSITFDKLSEDAIGKLEIRSSLRDYLHENINTFQYPENNTHFTTYATMTNDPYYDSFMGSLVEPDATLDENHSSLIRSKGYFFYRIKMIGVFSETKKASILLRNTNVKVPVQYRLLDESFSQVGDIITLQPFFGDVYVAENINIPENARTLEIRIDNRTNNTDTKLIKPIVSPYGKVVFPIEEINRMKQQNSELKKRIEQISTKDYGNIVPIFPPLKFNLGSFEIKNRVFLTLDGNYITDYDVEENKQNNGTVYYVDPINGSDGFSGKSPSSPFQSLNKAMSMSDVAEVKLKGGKHFRNKVGILVPANPKGINLTSYDGIAKLVHADVIEWKKTEGYNNVYQITRNGTGNVIDLSSRTGNKFLEFSKKNSIAEVDSNESSWFTQGGIVYAHYKEQPKANELVGLLSTDLIRTTSVDYFYMQDLELIGGLRPFRNESETASIYAKNVKFLHSVASNGNGFEMVGGKKSILQDCVAENNSMDGFNYHVGSTGSKPYSVEIGCVGLNNGWEKGAAGSKSNNGSTTHDGLKTVRLNCTYAYNDGGNVADVNSGTQSWNIGIRAFDSYQQADFLTSSGAEMWLEGCVAYGSKDSVKTSNVEDKVYLRDCRLANLAESQSITKY